MTAAISKAAASGAKASGKAAVAPLPEAFLKNYPLSIGTYLIPAGERSNFEASNLDP